MFLQNVGYMKILTDWQSDYMQQDKHYIFHTKNPVTDLEYGHMGIIAYNKKLVLECNDWGLDFT